MICIHSICGSCEKYHHSCNGEEDALRCPEWRTVHSFDQLSLAIHSAIFLHPGGKLIVRGLN